MENLNPPHDLDKIISLYEAESKRKHGVMATIIDKIKSIFSKRSAPSYSPAPIQTSSLVQNLAIEAIEPELSESEIFNSFNNIEHQNIELIDDVTPADTELNLESLQEFFKQHLSKEQEDLFPEPMLEPDDLFSATAQLPPSKSDSQPEFSSSSYHQRIRNHVQQESKNEQLWRRRQSIKNN